MNRWGRVVRAAVSVLLIGWLGTGGRAQADPSDQLRPSESSGLQSNRAHYEAATVPKAWGTLNGLNHNDIQGRPDCARASFSCTTGVYGYLGYPTAWLLAELRGDTTARSIFVAGIGRFLAPSPNWNNQTSTVH